MSNDPKISVVIPVYNERESLQPFWNDLKVILKDQREPYEIIFVDDGSNDGSIEMLKALSKADPRIRVIRLRRHAGQTGALTAGFRHTRGQVVVTLDADGQNDPEDIPKLLAELQKGYDLVSGWRRHRQDKWFRGVLSQMANRILTSMTGVPLHDFGCTLKAYRREALEGITPYGDMHRILPAYLAALGCCIGEMEVNHRPRIFGRSKYGAGRTFRVLLDIIAVSFVLRYSGTPIRAFGGIGLACMVFGAAVGLWVSIRAIFFGGIWVSPLILITMVLTVAGIQFIALGLLGEMLLWMRATDPRGKTTLVEELEHAKD